MKTIMDVFDNCRVCLKKIVHDPIKVRRFLLKFIEHGLSLKCVARQFTSENIKLNLCAVCINKLYDFQDFYEQLKESDEFWAAQFASDKQKSLETLPNIEEEDQNYVEEIRTRECSPSSKQSQEDYSEFKHEDEFIQIEPLHAKVDTTTHGAGNFAEPVCGETEGNENIVSFEDFFHWTEHRPDDEKNIEQEGRNHRPQPDADQELIEYEYELQQYNNDDNDELSQPEAPSSTVVELEFESINMNCDFDDIDECKSCDSPIQEMLEYVLDSTEPLQGQYGQECIDSKYIETTIDDSGKVKKSYQCQHCDKEFDRISDIESHYEIHKREFVCEVCGRSFRQKSILVTHQALHFGKKIECPECGKKYARKSQLILHFRMHRDEKPFVCHFDGCVAAFRRRQHLSDHLFIHTGEKHFQCSTCNKSFLTRKRLQDHVYKVHSSHRFGCDMCNKAFLKPHMLKNHLLNAHNCELSDVSHLKVSVDPLKRSKKSKVDFQKS